MKNIIVAIFLSLFVLCACATKPTPEPEKKCYPKVTILKGVNFDYSKSTLKPGSYPALDENIAILKSRPKMTITIVGHTDSDGDEIYNQKLSEARAKAVMQYFLEKGIPAGRMQAIGKGESAPIADNKTEAGKAQNRRIEIRVHGSGAGCDLQLSKAIMLLFNRVYKGAGGFASPCTFIQYGHHYRQQTSHFIAHILLT